MSRYMVRDLKQYIEAVNLTLTTSGSEYFYKYDARNGYHAVDLYNSEGCVNNLDCWETPRVLADRIYQDYTYYLGRKS